MLDKEVCKACIGDFASSWSETRESLWRMGDLFCTCLRRKINVKEIPEDCRCRDQHNPTAVSEEEVYRWTVRIDDIRDAAWGAILDRREFFIRHSFKDSVVGDSNHIRCRETDELISEESCFFGHKVHFFDLVDEFLASFKWDVYKNVRVTRDSTRQKIFADPKVTALWLNFYKSKAEFSAQLLSRNGAHIRDQRWISNVQREDRDGISRVVYTRDGMPYRYLVGSDAYSPFVIKVTNKKLGGKGEYIGRPSPLGNPFRVESEKQRGKVISQYREWLLGKVKSKDDTIVSELKRLRSLAETQGELNLACWCSPKQCHGEVIKEVIENLPSLVPSAV